MKYLLIISMFFSASNYANSVYDDWEKRTVNTTTAVQHFGGNYTCKYNQYRFGYDIHSGQFGYHTQDRSYTTYIPDSITARPVLTIQDVAEYPAQNGAPINNPSYNYICRGVADLPPTYVEHKVVGTRVEYHPIQPFPTYASFQYAGCISGGYVRAANLYINGPSSSSTTIKDLAYGGALYSGPSSGWISMNFGDFGTKNLGIKLDNGSTYQLTVNIPACSGGGSNIEPL